jgi:hypothetical protein
MGRLNVQAAVVGILALVVALTSGCAALNSQKSTAIYVQFSGNDMLHVAIIPRVLPDGQPAAKQRDALLKDVADVAGGYTLIERVTSTWKSKGSSGAAMKEADDLLLVEGPAVLGAGLRQRLHDDFGQPSPYVLSLPIQDIHIVPQQPLPLQKPGAAPAPQQQTPAEQKPEPAK